MASVGTLGLFPILCWLCRVMECVTVSCGASQSKNELLEFSVMPDGHRNYAITWFTMSAFMLGLALHAMKLNRKPLRKMPSMAK